MMLNKKVIESAAVLGLATVLSITAVTNSDKAVIANTSVEYDGIAGVTAALADYQQAGQHIKAALKKLEKTPENPAMRRTQTI